MKDDFDGDYLAVLDKNYKRSGGGNIASETGIVSNWAQNRIRVFAYTVRRQCGFLNVVCRDIDRTGLETRTLDIRIGDQAFNLRGENGNFLVSPELAAALYNVPPGKAKIRITLEGSGGTINNDIGEETVKAWKVVYKPSK
ncbi:hypothetical protein H6F89_27900 [Cyanobacteria bacterium FACHB-63]|nr:hypothetical protein [Cyanobacteria bacterium FACHB-63]